MNVRYLRHPAHRKPSKPLSIPHRTTKTWSLDPRLWTRRSAGPGDRPTPPADRPARRPRQSSGSSEVDLGQIDRDDLRIVDPPAVAISEEDLVLGGPDRRPHGLVKARRALSRSSRSSNAGRHERSHDRAM